MALSWTQAIPLTEGGTSSKSGGAGGEARNRRAAPAPAGSDNNWRRASFMSIRVALVGLYDSDSMIGEFLVRAEEFQARHVASDAIPGCDAAHMGSGFRGSRRMTRGAFRV